MNVNVEREWKAISRTVQSGTRENKPTREVRVGRAFGTNLDDLWDALTNAERIRQWMLPISGDLRLGGTYRLEGNASGTITACDPPASFSATWEYAGEVSWVEVRLQAISSTETHLELTHISPVDENMWDQYGPGATGVGWDLSLLGLSLHVSSGAPRPPEADGWESSDEGRRFCRASSDAWAAASVEFGTEPGTARAAADRTTAFYTGVSE